MAITTGRITMAALLSLSEIPDFTNNHSLTNTISDSTTQQTIQNATNLIAKWDPTQKFTSIFHQNRPQAEEFIACVEELRTAMHFLIAHRPYSNLLAAANNLIKLAMLRLETEFFYILSANRDCLSPQSVSGGSSRLLSPRSLSFSNSEEDDNEDADSLLLDRAMADLKMIAETMIASGYGKECGNIYRVTRKSIVDEEVYRLGIRTYNPSQIMRLDHKSLQRHVDKWILAAKIAVKSIFRGEKLLCDRVFAVSDTMNQTCIAHTTMEAAMNLLRFPELVAKTKASPEKIVLLMNLFETVSDLWPEIESIFSYETLSPIKSQALASIQKLTESTQAILAEFVSSIQKNASKTPPAGGGIHPLTYKVMDYVALLADRAGTLSDILADDTPAQSPFPESYFDCASPTPNSGVASRFAWIILVLLCKLDSKAEIYKDIGLSYLFLANNLQFVVDRVGATSLRFLLGEDWLSNQEKKVKLYAGNYESVAWAKVMAALPAAAEAEAEAESSPAAIKEQFRRFNAAFQAAYKKQSAWSVPDPKLRDEIKMSIARKIVPAYRRFYESCYVAIVNEERNLEVLVRFSPDNLGNYLSDLFHATVEISEDSSPPASPLSSSHYKLKLARCL